MWLNLLEASKRSELTEQQRRFRNALLAEWSRRAAEALKNPAHFDWPTTDAKGGDGSIAGATWPGEGMLSYLGYRVGVTQGLTESARRQILDVLFSAALPPINGPIYMREWDKPHSPMRLRKLAETLASLTRNAKRKKGANMDSAIADWERDLQYLYTQYYVGRFAFAWPSIET